MIHLHLSLIHISGFGAVLGHNFPFFLNFKGGKGIACTASITPDVHAICPIAAPICLVLFILAVAITRYVSLGSILVVKMCIRDRTC